MTDWHAWLSDYYERYKPDLYASKGVFENLVRFKELAIATRDGGGKLMLAGNGASASIAAHGAVDMTKQGRIPAVVFNEANLITCFANDFGYENWMARAIECYGGTQDAVVLISVSGMSPSIIRAAEAAIDLRLPIVTFTGRSPDNQLRRLGNINFWYDSRAYNVVECVHMMWLTTVIDMIVGQAEYTVS